ncbi:MAG: hypothetical protein ABI690_16890 [Chloroflexota bacterium]
MEKAKEKRQHPLSDAQSKLMNALRFTEEDLQANRDGYLMKQQRSKLNGIRTSWLLCFILTLIVVPFLVAWTVIDGVRIHDTAVSRLGIIGLIWIIASGTCVYCWFKKRRLDHDLHKGNVQVVKGTAQVKYGTMRQKGTSPYDLIIDGLTWNMGYFASSAFTNGDPYAIYYAPHSKQILSAEWLREG